ncbi:beta-lactam response regulator transcription factor BlrA [soil metagenome]
MACPSIQVFAPIPLPMPALLLVEDDPAIARTVAYALEREGFTVDVVALVREARVRLSHSDRRFSAAILDVGLPDGSGLDLCREIRAAGPLPVLMLSARSEEIDRILGLELGADDYLAKPFSPRELCARVRALIRRSALTAAAVSAAAPQRTLLECDVDRARIRLDEQWLSLTRREFGLLERLMRVPGNTWSRDSLLDAVLGDAADSVDRTVDTHVKTLRAKLREVRPDLELIVTHRGLGYSLELPAVQRPT